MQSFIKNISSDENFPLRGEVFLNLFDQYVDFLLEDQASIDYVERCAVYFNSLDATLIDALCEASIRSCNERAEMVGAPTTTFASSRDVLKLITPSALLIPDTDARDKPVARMELHCAWDTSLGLEWLIREDKILYVGPFMDVDPWGDFSNKDSFNCA